MLAIRSWVIVRTLDGKRSRLRSSHAAELLIDRMVAIAHGRLHHLRKQRLGIAEQQSLQLAVTIEFRQ